MTAAPEELQDRVNEAIRKRRIATVVDDLGKQRTLWLAAPPLWTRSAAVQAGFPAESESVTDFVRRARSVGWCETRGSLDADGPTELRFWMPDEVRRDVLDIMRELADGDLEAVRNDAKEVAARVVSHAREADLPGALRAWADLLAEAEPDDVPSRLIKDVRQAVDVHDLSLAQELVIAGEALEPVLEGAAVRDLERARQLLDGGLNRREEERRLGRYFNRPELSMAVERILDPQTDKWALHLRGVGGVGKTTLIRYLTSGRYAEDRHLAPIPMACVNFDHISPDYPVRKPVQLLQELADRLAPYTAASSAADHAMGAFRDNADWANNTARNLQEGSARPLENRDVREAIDAFADVVNKLGGALLILDTCEELAKWGAGNPNSPAIQATLGIVERLHQQAGSLRVLFAGRRHLPRPGWLDVLNVKGFTSEEARRYLAEFGKRALTADLANEMIRQSRAVDDPERVNPFDLALYRAWADEERGPSLEEVRRGSDAYVESRVIKRLGDPFVIRSLPVLAVGGKCRVETIAIVLGCDDVADLGWRLEAQEWISAEGGTSPEFVTAWQAMARKLQRYYEVAERQDEFSRVTRQFAEVLLQRLGDALLDPVDADIDLDEVVAALRLAEPAEAARLWDKIAEWATIPPGRWGTVATMTERILGEGIEEEWPTTEAVRGAVLAAHIAAYRRRRDVIQADVQGLWAQVLAAAGGHPDEKRQRRLRVLGALGSLPYAHQHASLWDVLYEEQESLTSSPEVGTAAIDAIHRLMEEGNRDAAGRLWKLLDLESLRRAFEAWSSENASADEGAWTAANRSLAWARVAEARLLADSNTRAARAALEQAENLVSAAVGPEPSWPHWVPPEDLLARIRIERGLIDRELFATPSDLAALDPWEEYAARHLHSVDGERLASLCLRLRLRHRAVPASVAERWEAADSYKRGRIATNSAHGLVPPLFVSVAEAWASAGQPERAVAVLELRRSEANAAQDDDATVRCADAAMVSLARRLRLTDQRSLLARLADPSEYRREASPQRMGTLDDARRAWAVIYREPPPEVHVETDRLAGWHAWCQCQPAEVLNPVPPVPWSPANPEPDLASLADIQADLMEMRLLGRLGLEQVRGQLDALLDRPGQASGRSLTPARSANPYHRPRLDLRWDALDQMRYTPPAKAPVRLIAEMAFEEAELLSLRLPAAAARVYRVAANAYARCGDHIGRLLALAAYHDALSECPEEDRRSLLGALSSSISAAMADLADALGMVGLVHPDVAAILVGPPEDAGAWRYWAQTVQRHIGRPSPVIQAGTRASSVVHGEAPESAGPARHANGATATLRVLLGVLALPLAVVLAGGIRAAFQLAAERGVGAARIETLIFDATIGEAAPDRPDDTVRLRVGPRPWGSAPVRTWWRPRLWAIIVAAWLVRSGWPRRFAGYSGFLAPEAAPADAGGISWTPPLDSPRSTWWERQPRDPVAGTMRTSRAQAAQPWERILAASLGPPAAGRIEWVRLAADLVRPVHTGGGYAELIAAPAWERPLAEYYRRPESSLDPRARGRISGLVGPASSGRPAPRVRHVIGRAVRTSAGPCMKVSGESRPGRGTGLLAVGDLARGRPLVIVLQAEPADEDGTGAGRHYDLADKLRLATALMDDGVPAVLILPALPTRLAREVARTVTVFADAPDLSRQDIRVALLRPLRAVIARHVGPAVLDDIILFLNARYA